MWECCKIFCSPEWKKGVWGMCSSNKMKPLLTQLEIHWTLWEKIFPDVWFLRRLMWDGLHGDQIWAFVISFFWDIWRKGFLSVVLTPYQSYRSALLKKLTLYPAKCERAVQSFRDHLQQCVAANAHHLGDIIFEASWLLKGMYCSIQK